VADTDPSDPTLAYYEHNAGAITTGYETVDLSATLQGITKHLAPGARVLELGAGSGRDAAWLLARGFDVIALDGSQAMAEHAAKLHPELAGRIVVHRLPAALPVDDSSVDAVVSLATLMHLPEADLPGVLGECRRVLRPAGRSAISVPIQRPGVDANGRDERGRRFTVLAAERWTAFLREAGFSPVDEWQNADALGRAGIRWLTVVVAPNAM
jgi:SAM-dependent methyltransferase